MQITLDELMDKIDATRARMSRHSDANLLLAQCKDVIVQLAAQLPDPEPAPAPEAIVTCPDAG